MSPLVHSSLVGGGPLWSPLQLFDLLPQAPLHTRETATHHVLRLDVPGIGPGDLDLELVANTLHIRAQAPGRAYAVTTTLPRDADPDRIEASLEHGRLVITIGKHPSSQPRRIPVGRGRKVLDVRPASGRWLDRVRAWWRGR